MKLRLPRLQPRTLVGRVFALYSVTLIGFVALGLALFYRYQLSGELEEAQLRADSLSAVIQPAITDSAVIGDYDTIRRTLQNAVYHSSFSSATFIDLSGGVVRVPRDDPAEVSAPHWLVDVVAARLYDTNLPIAVGGRDYGVLRLSFSPERIAGRLWEQTRVALLLGLACLVGGLLLIRLPLVRWLGKLSRVQDFDEAMRSGDAAPALLSADDTPAEFRETFEVLGRAAATLQQQRLQAAVTLGAIADGVFTLDAEGRVVLVNPAACALTGQPRDALLGRLVDEVLAPVFAGAAPGAALAPWTGRRATLPTAAWRAAVVVDTSLSTVQAPDGTVAGHVLACRDISAQHALELRLRTELREREAALVALRQVLEGLPHDLPHDLPHNLPHGEPNALPAAAPAHDDLAAVSQMISALVRQLQERGAQLDAIFALSADGFVSFDAQRRVNYVSPAFTHLTGLPEPQLLGVAEQAVEALLLAHCTPTPPWRGFEPMRRELRALEAPPAGATEGTTGLAQAEPPRRERFETQRPARRTLEVALREGQTEAISQVLSLRDVTHETLVEQMKSEFLSTAAHELRTPMASIYGFSELLLRRQLTPERQRDLFETIHRQSQLMVSIINELLDLARIESRRGKDFVLEPLDLGALLPEVLQDFRPPQDRAGPRWAAPAAPARVRADRNKLRQAIGNVLSNAYKYSPQGGAVDVRVLAGGGAAAPLWGVEVRDAGIGMTPAQLARVSERFYRADTSGRIAGTGLGMSIVKEIVELLGGSLAMASEFGAGTTVTLWLPVQPGDTERDTDTDTLATA